MKTKCIRNKLIIIAQPSSKGFTHKIVKKYSDKSKEFGASVDIIDLYDSRNLQPFLSFENMKELNDDPNRKIFQNKISWANELVFVFPIWWGTMPGIMKNFIDTNFEAGFAYKFVKGKSVPKKLLEGKTVKVFVTCDGLSIIYNNHIAPLYLEEYLRIYIFGVFGLKMTDFELYDKMRKKTEEEKNEILEKIEKHLELENMSFSFKKVICTIIGD